MIDNIALAIGHTLLAFAIFRLVMRDDVDTDPAITRLKDKAAAEREAASVIGRNAKRRRKNAGAFVNRHDSPLGDGPH